MKGYVHEIYLSVSGEGITTGVPTIFVRLAGCSLRCGKTKDGRSLWCDTPYALSPNKGESLSIESIREQILNLSGTGIPQVLISGGEPLEGENAFLVKKLGALRKEICKNPNHPFPRVETNGAQSIQNLPDLVFTIDYKLPGSGMEEFMNLDNFSELERRDQPLDEIKFVIRDRLDWERSLEIYRIYKPKTGILFSPVEKDLDPAELADWVRTVPIPNARLSLQIHKILWGNKRGV
jgi:7-carboxy-7-deazaguanine synthase